MSSATPGWYVDRNEPTILRWWSGQVWTSHTKPNLEHSNAPTEALTRVQPQADLSRANPNNPTTATSLSADRSWAGPIAAGVAVLLVSIIAAASSGFGGFLLVWGLVLLAGGLYAFFSKRPGVFRLPSKRAAAIVITSGLLVTLMGTGASAFMQPAAPLAVSASSTATPSATSAPTPAPTPVVVTAQVRETSAIPFERSTVQDAARDVGTSAITTPGADGELTTIIQVTTTDGVETSREQIGQEVTRAPVTEVTSQGTRLPAPAPAPPIQQAPPAAAPAPGCDPNYAGACVPVSSDVDCAGGSGNGPEYVRGPIRVIGSDIYDLDRDGDGIACD